MTENGKQPKGALESFDIENEKNLHGDHWASVLGGYFSDPAIARSLVDALQKAIERHSPTVLVDIGGGTGFILSELSRIYPNGQLRLIDLDASPTQLSGEQQHNITKIQAMAQDVKREDLCGEDDVLMLTMRSVLQYFGPSGTEPFLKDLASLLKPGECMVHQSACFDNEQNARFISKFTEMSQIGKGAPLTANLKEILGQSGWRVQDVIDAPPLPMDSAFLAKRYKLDNNRLRATEALGREFEEADAFSQLENGFIIRMDYKIFTSIRK